MHVAIRPPSLISSSTPLSQSLSFLNDGSAREVVVDRRWSWSRVTESDEFVGRISLVSRLPQYLSTVSDRRYCVQYHSLDACNVHRCRGCGLIDGHRGQRYRSGQRADMAFDRSEALHDVSKSQIVRL